MPANGPGPIERDIEARLAQLESKNLIRTPRPPAGIDFCSNDYLGLANHPEIKRRMAEAVMREGAGSTGSRLLRGERESFQAIEERFAGFKGTERSLYFSSGYLANIAVLSTYPGEGDVIFSDDRNHASLIDGIRLSRAKRVIFPHNDASELRRLVHAEGAHVHKYVVTESLFSMDGDYAPLREYAEICAAEGAALIVDEAHAVGVHGATGSGCIEEQGVSPDVFVSINTAGKALGVSGAFVAGSRTAIEYLLQRARPFIFSTAPPPAVAAGIDAALDIVAAEPERRVDLLARANHLRERLGMPPGSPIIPVILGSNERAMAVATELQAAGFDVRAIRPPTVPAGTARLRISVHADQTEAQLDAFLTAFHKALEKAPEEAGEAAAPAR